jgi:hypothetical protein
MSLKHSHECVSQVSMHCSTVFLLRVICSYAKMMGLRVGIARKPGTLARRQVNNHEYYNIVKFQLLAVFLGAPQCVDVVRQFWELNISPDKVGSSERRTAGLEALHELRKLGQPTALPLPLPTPMLWPTPLLTPPSSLRPDSRTDLLRGVVHPCPRVHRSEPAAHRRGRTPG